MFESGTFLREALSKFLNRKTSPLLCTNVKMVKTKHQRIFTINVQVRLSCVTSNLTKLQHFTSRWSVTTLSIKQQLCRHNAHMHYTESRSFPAPDAVK